MSGRTERFHSRPVLRALFLQADPDDRGPPLSPQAESFSSRPAQPTNSSYGPSSFSSHKLVQNGLKDDRLIVDLIASAVDQRQRPGSCLLRQLPQLLLARPELLAITRDKHLPFGR